MVTGGIVTARDSNWLMSWTFNRQPHFKEQRDDEIVGWIYGLFPEQPGNYINKPMEQCTGEQITAEWLFHTGVPVAEIPDLAAGGAQCVPCMMPYVTAFFMPRKAGDRPDVVPEGSVNFAFIGQFAETSRDCIFTTEYSVRTGMEAAYQLLNIDRGVPEPFASTYDVRALLRATSAMRDERKLSIAAPAVVRHEILDKLASNQIGKLLEQAGII